MRQSAHVSQLLNQIESIVLGQNPGPGPGPIPEPPITSVCANAPQAEMAATFRSLKSFGYSSNGLNYDEWSRDTFLVLGSFVLIATLVQEGLQFSKS